MSPVANINTYRIELIVGNGSQLDSDNVRYIIRVYTSNVVDEELSYDLYKQENGSRVKVVPTKTSVALNNQFGYDLETVLYTVDGHATGDIYFLSINSEAAKHPDIKVSVYPFSDYMVHILGMGGTDISNQILNQNLSDPSQGYAGEFRKPTGIYDQDSMFYLEYTDKDGNIIDRNFVSFVVAADISYVDGYIYGSDGQNKVDVTCLLVDGYDSDLGDMYIDMSTGKVSGRGIQNIYYMLQEGLSPDDEYYCLLNAHGTDYGDAANSFVVKAVEGIFDSLDETEGLPDIKEQLIPANRNNETLGYKGNYNYQKQGKYFTVFFEDGSVFRFNVRISEYDSRYDPNYKKAFTDAPIIGAADPWFRVTGASQDGKTLEAYIVENGKEINMDTMYGYGYQTIIIYDDAVDLTRLQPTVWVADDESVKLYVDGQPFSNGNVIDCSDMVQFTAVIDGHQKNYQVKFAKKAPSATLYVVGPSIREVFLDEYFEYKHDIFIANLGTEALTGLKVELDATNCKLDDYWIVGGKGNDVLPAFTAITSDTSHGEPSNIAKIRILPDGDGDIEGTLTISADGQEPVVITLTGCAQNPKIRTSVLPHAVQYVPYSYIVTTSNMYDWTDVSFTLTGDLPEGINWYPETGELYGVPTVDVPDDPGYIDYDISIEADFTSETYDFESSTVHLTLRVLDNTNYNVYTSSTNYDLFTDDEYALLTPIGEDIGGYDFVLESNPDGSFNDTEFRSNGLYGNFMRHVYLNGQELIEGVDYTSESGSTKITIFAETFENTDKTNDSGVNTIAAEFRVDGDRGNDLRRTAQNFRLESNTAPTPTPTPTPFSTPTPTPTPTMKPSTPTPTPTATINPSTLTPTPTATSGVVNTDTPTPSPVSPSPVPSDATPNPVNPGRVTPSPTYNPNGNVGGSTGSNGVNNSGSKPATSSVTCATNIVGADGAPIANLSLELHSTPQSAITSSSGYATFDEVDFGSHTLYVKEEDGKTAASKAFTLASGNATSLSGDTINARPGSTIILSMRFDGSNLEILSVHTDTGAPKTGDDSTLVFYFALLLLSLAGIGTIYGICIRKRLDY